MVNRQSVRSYQMTFANPAVILVISRGNILP